MGKKTSKWKGSSREQLLKPTGSNQPLDGNKGYRAKAQKATPGKSMGGVHKRQTGGTKGMDSPMGRMDKKTGSRPGSVPSFPSDKSCSGVAGNRGPISTASPSRRASGVPKTSGPSLPKQKGRGVKGGGNKATGKSSVKGKYPKGRGKKLGG